MFPASSKVFAVSGWELDNLVKAFYRVACNFNFIPINTVTSIAVPTQMQYNIISPGVGARQCPLVSTLVRNPFVLPSSPARE
ncbi:hypothetical protein [Nostoc commune]|uniref:hypothetical protein n=1 Tax=Nostoc commune TaxID=1178 RepID=UPI002073B6A4|nr:hypothetical protein [Nostoc commune]